MNHTQSGILEPVPQLARYLAFSLLPGTDPKIALKTLCRIASDNHAVIGLGHSLLLALGTSIQGMRDFPPHVGAGIDIPSTPFSLWCWLRGEDRGDLVHRSRSLRHALAQAFHLEQVIDAFKHGQSRDLSGYEDGTENPEGDEAIEAAIVSGMGPGLDGSSFVAVQQWVHNLDRFQAMPQAERDNVIGRRVSDNKEMDDAPVSAHVKRATQESFEPEAFMLRRSMPWASETREGLVFVAFGHRFDAFEAVLKRMTGQEDGISDALFRFTRPLTGSYFWCPPVVNGQLDLSAAGI